MRKTLNIKYKLIKYKTLQKYFGKSETDLQEILKIYK